MKVKDMLKVLLDKRISIISKSDLLNRYLFNDRIKGYKVAGAIITASVDRDYITYKVHDENGKFLHAYLLEV